MKLNDLSGKRFGRLTAISISPRKSGNHVLWKCICDCGNEVIVSSTDLRSGHTKSCGCYKSEVLRSASTKHGCNNTRLYRIWGCMKSRCTNPNVPSSKHYLSKGVSICDDWLHDFNSFKEWAYENGWEEQQKGTPYKYLLSIDRIDATGNYEPSNCRIVTISENSTEANNRRWNNYRKMNFMEGK